MRPLETVSLLFREKGAFADLPHVVNAVSLYLDSSVELPLHEACALQSPQLLERLWSSLDEPADGWTLRRYLRSDRHYRQHQFTLSLQEAATQRNLQLVKWLCDRFEGCTVATTVVTAAIEAGAIAVLQFLYDNDSKRLGVTTAAVTRAGVGHSVQWSTGDLVKAVESGSPVVSWLRCHVTGVPHNLDAALEMAVRRGDILVAEWLLARSAEWPVGSALQSLLCDVVKKGRLDVLQWLDEQEQVGTEKGLVVKAAEHGHLDIVRWLIARDEPTSGATLYGGLTDLDGEAGLSIHAAAVNGHLQVAKYLHACARHPSSSLERAVQFEKQQARLQTSLRMASTVSAKTMAEAATRGHLAVVQWLFAEYGDDRSVDLFTIEERCNAAMDGAASNGHLDVLKHLHELQMKTRAESNKRLRDGQPKVPATPQCSAGAIVKAAQGGHLEVVQWLHQVAGIPCRSKAMDAAATNGHLDVLQWLYHHRSGEYATNAIDFAATYGHLHVVRWLHTHTDSTCTTDAIDTAAENGFLDVIKWLHHNRSEGCTAAAMDNAAARGDLDVVRWLHRNRSEGCSEEAMDGAADEGQLEVLQWLHRNRTEGCSSLAMNRAAEYNKFEVLLYLHDHLHQKCDESKMKPAFEFMNDDVREWMLERHPALRRIRWRRREH